MAESERSDLPKKKKKTVDIFSSVYANAHKLAMLSTEHFKGLSRSIMMMIIMIIIIMITIIIKRLNPL